MMNPPIARSPITSYLKLFVLLGIGVGFLLLVSIRLITSYMQSERENGELLKDESTQFLHVFELKLKEGKEDLIEFLQPTPKLNPRKQWIETLKQKTNEYYKNHQEDFFSFLKEITHYTELVSDLYHTCAPWNSHYVSVQNKINQTRNQLYDSINMFHELTNIAEGENRIQLAALIHRYRDSSAMRNDTIGAEIIGKMTALNFSNLKMEIGTLSLLIERLISETEIDVFVDYKDNQIKPVLSRIERIVGYLNDASGDKYLAITNLKREIINELFGDGALLNDEYQTIELGREGLYSFLLDALLLERERQKNLDRISLIFNQFEEILIQMQNALYFQLENLSINTGIRIQYASYIIYAITFLLSAVFLLLASVIVKAVNRQVVTIHSVNQRLQSQTQELETVNQTLYAEIERRKVTEKALTISEERYRSLFETSRDSIVFVTLDGRIEDPNQAYLDLLGYSREEALNKSITDFTPSQWNEFEERIHEEQVMKQGFSEEYEKEVVRKDGSIRYVSVRSWLVNNEKKKPIRTLRILRDITERKILEGELQRKTLEYERQQVMIKSFATICHYLSQPLTVLWGLLRLLKNTPEFSQDKKVSKYINQCIESTDKMSSLINKLRAIDEYKTTDYTKLTEMVEIEKESENNL